MRAAFSGVLALLSAGLLAAERFEILPLVDECDYCPLYDIESAEGVASMFRDVMRTHPTTLLWRDKGAGRMWYPSAEESSVYPEHPLEKRIVPTFNQYSARLARPGIAMLANARSECEKAGVGFGLHTGFEENHQCPSSESNWNMAHPQFMCRPRSGAIRLVSASLAFPEVVEHKLRLVDERLALKPEAIFLDFHRGGGWSVDLEYVKPVCDRWRAKYGCEPPESATDPRWIALCSEDIMAYLRAFSAKCRKANVRFLLGIQKLDLRDEYMWTRYGLDWKRLVAEGALDGLVVMGVAPDTSRPFESAREILEYAKSKCGKTKMYWQASSYKSNNGIPCFAEWTGLGYPAVMRKMIGIAREVGCSGVILECVDPGHYTDEMCQILKEQNE